MKGLKELLGASYSLLVLAVFIASVWKLADAKVTLANLAAHHVHYDVYEYGERGTLGDALDDIQKQAPQYYPEARRAYWTFWGALLCMFVVPGLMISAEEAYKKWRKNKELNNRRDDKGKFVKVIKKVPERVNPLLVFVVLGALGAIAGTWLLHSVTYPKYWFQTVISYGIISGGVVCFTCIFLMIKKFMKKRASQIKEPLKVVTVPAE